MHDLGLEPSGDTYDGFVKAVVYGKGVAYGMKVVISMNTLIYNVHKNQTKS